MGLACPVCGSPQRDAEHLANHLAIVAMLHGDAHEDWLDERAPGWVEEDPAGLGERVAPHAEEADYEAVFEDTADGGGRPEAARGPRAAPDDDATRAAVEAARRLTERMREDGDEE